MGKRLKGRLGRHFGNLCIEEAIPNSIDTGKRVQRYNHSYSSGTWQIQNYVAVTQGVRQGISLSPRIVLIHMDEILRKLDDKTIEDNRIVPNFIIKAMLFWGSSGFVK